MIFVYFEVFHFLLFYDFEMAFYPVVTDGLWNSSQDLYFLCILGFPSWPLPMGYKPPNRDISILNQNS